MSEIVYSIKFKIISSKIKVSIDLKSYVIGKYTLISIGFRVQTYEIIGIKKSILEENDSQER